MYALDYKVGDQIIFENAADVDLYAVWNVVYRIHYDRDSTPTNQTTYTSQGNISVVVPYLYGATTDYSSYYDYYLESNGLIVFDSRKIPDVPLVRNNTGSTSLRLGWKQVTISFDLQGGTADSAEDRTYYAKYGTLNNIPTPTKEGYVFKGWTPSFTKNSAGNTSWPIEDTVYVAQWELVKYKVTYKYLNGANSSNLIKEFTMETDCDLVNPSLSGYEFDGWYKDVGFKERVTHIDSGTIQNITLLGKWKKTYTDSMCSEQIKALGDIVLSNGKVVNCGGIEGLCIEFPDEIKNKAIAVITHTFYDYDNYKTYWRGMGLIRSEDRLDWTTTPSKIKYNESGKNLDFDCYFDGKNSTDILLTMDSSAKANQDNYPAWKYVWNYGKNYLSDAIPLPGLSYTDGWYLPASKEISSTSGNFIGEEYFYYILLSLEIDLNSSDEFWTCNTYKDGNSVGNPYKNNQGDWKLYIPGDRTYMSVSTYIWTNYPSNKKCYVYAFHDFGEAK